MAIKWNLAVVMADRGISGSDLAKAIGITPQHLSDLKRNGPIQLSMELLDSLCFALSCQPGDLLSHDTPLAGAGQDDQDSRDLNQAMHESKGLIPVEELLKSRSIEDAEG